MWAVRGKRVQFVKLDDVTIHHQVISAPGRPLIVFANALGTDFRIWRDVVVRLAGDFAVLLYDLRGHGLSELGEAPVSIDRHAADLAALMDHHGFRSALVCGLSVGGMIGQQLWADRRDLVAGLILCGTAHRIGTPESWAARMAEVEAGGVEAVADAVMQRWFTPAFLSEPECRGYRTMVARQAAAGYIATCGAIRGADLAALAARIDVPALVVAGADDIATPPSLCADFARLIPNSRFELVKNAGHMLPVEQPEMLSEIIRAFADLYSEGTAADAGTRH